MRKLAPKRVVLFAGILGVLAFSSCTSLKPHERIFINDPDMQMGLDAGLSFQNYIHSIREGAVPPGTSKSSGGCGCNE